MNNGGENTGLVLQVEPHGGSKSGGKTEALARRTFELSAEDLRKSFSKNWIYPLKLSGRTLGAAPLDLYIQTIQWFGYEFKPESKPWIPVGRVGPILILGHWDPLMTEPPLPSGMFQPVLLLESDYESHLETCVSYISNADKIVWDGTKVAAPRKSRCTEKPQPENLREALEALLDFYPHDPEDLKKVTSVLSVPKMEISRSMLPYGYYGASWFLMGFGGLVDLALIDAKNHSSHIPSDLVGTALFVTEYERNLWVACEELPRQDYEDSIRNHLGDGWEVIMLMFDGSKAIIERPNAQPYDTRTKPRDQRATTQRASVHIDSRREVNEPINTSGEITFTMAELRSLQSYDPRRTDREPVSIARKFISLAIEEGASDLHFEPGFELLRIRARIDGILQEWLTAAMDFGEMVIGSAKCMVGLNPDKNIPQDCSCLIHHGNNKVNVRVSTYPTVNRIQKMVLRFLPKRGAVPKLTEIMPDTAASMLYRAATRPQGLILMCGPTGSGKTTTVFSTLAEINTSEINITTMEDPVEYQLDGCNQAEINEKQGAFWGVMMKGFLRQDPDASLIGEIRDRQSAEVALQLSLTGHIVFATLHTLSCATTIRRLIDLGVESEQLIDALTLIVSQRLLRRVCHKCKRMRVLRKEEQAAFEKSGMHAPAEVPDLSGTDCEECRSKGYKGRVAAIEMLPITNEVKGMIIDKCSTRDIEAYMRNQNLPTVYQSALRLVAEGITTMEEASEWEGVWDFYDFNKRR